VLAIESLEREAWGYCHQLIAVDNGQQDILVAQHAPRSAIVVIPNAVDPQEIDRFRKPRTGSGADYMIAPRHLVPKNGVEYALRAFASIGTANLRLAIVGTGYLKPQLQAMCRDLGIETRVDFLGCLPRERVIALMWHAKAVIIPSISVAGLAEATSIAALEGMASARVVIASAVGGLREIVEHGMTGLLVREKDPEALAAAMRWTISNPEAAEQLGNRARRSVDRRFSLGPWCDRIESVYHSARNLPLEGLPAAAR
jgi:glycosyltransferase involved in cell wall biosynthesis